MHTDLGPEADVQLATEAVRRPARPASPGKSWASESGACVPYFFCSTRTQSTFACTPPAAILSTLDWGRPQ